MIDLKDMFTDNKTGCNITEVPKEKQDKFLKDLIGYLFDTGLYSYSELNTIQNFIILTWLFHDKEHYNSLKSQFMKNSDSFYRYFKDRID